MTREIHVDVNRPSRSTRRSRHWRTVLTFLIGSFASVSVAHADRVVLVSASGDAPLEERDDVEDAIASALGALSHEVLGERVGASTDTAPQTANELRAIAELQQAEWALVPIVHDSSSDAYWITLRAGYAIAGRVEELDAEVRRSNQDERLRALLQAMLRPEGLSEDGFALAGEDGTTRENEAAAAAADEEERRRAEEEAARQAEEEAARLAAEEEEARRQAEEDAALQAQSEAEAFANRDRYGVADGLTMVQLGMGIKPLVSTGDRGNGGVLGTIELGVGRGFESVPGLELRGGVDVVFGAASALTLHVGAAYLYSPITAPLHIGASAGVGLFQTISGQRGPGFLVRATLLVSYNLTGGLYLEASVPEFMWLTNGGGAVALGASLRAGYRF